MFIIPIILTILFRAGESTPIISGNDVGEVEQMGKTVLVSGQTKYPYMVHTTIISTETDSTTGKLVSQLYKSCGGVIISKSAVLTVAHCITDPITQPKVVVRAGIVDLEYEITDGQSIWMKNYVIHEKFGGNCQILSDLSEFCANDIAILWLQKSFVFEATVKKAILAGPNDSHIKKKGWIIGWGENEEGLYPHMLQEAELNVMPNDLCQLHIQEVKITAKMICLQSDSLDTMSCSGDSGGPFVADGKVYGISSLHALVEIGEKITCDTTRPAVYTRVGAYEKWIDGKLKSNPNFVDKLKMDKNPWSVNRNDFKLSKSLTDLRAFRTQHFCKESV